MSNRQLYRTEALNARQIKWLGDIVLIRPVAFTFLCLLACLCAVIVLLFLFFGTYTKRSTVTGQLVPDLGLVKIYVPQFGIVVKKNVVEGQVIKQGDVLYVLSSERRSDTQGSVQETISSQVSTRRDSLKNALEKTRRLNEDERNATVKRIGGLDSEIAKIGSQIEGQASRVKLAEEAVARMRDLEAQRFISREQLQQRQADLLDQRARLQSLERDRISVRRDLASQRSDLESMPLRHQNTLAQIEREIMSVGQELTESEAKRRLEITAPESGIATAVMAEVGQTVDGGKPLVSIVPVGATMQAYLYAPSRAIGFVRPGDKVLMRYQAYPYQKFGQAQGTVAHAAKVALSGSDLFGMSGFSGPASGSEPLYRVTVKISGQTIQAYGRPQPLQAGMTLEADILQEKRRLYEWVLEPLYSLSGKL
ncbi:MULTISPECIES: HlyD family secretion protein [unclassified Duganella]|uniref:HlyD family secretion protein n=1 Tax=unclassified Duganella TaxID=2636909 RepID=UPI000E34C5E5|nr:MULTISPECIES: HlyD family efflux transporter periplasmic adaptor subunit [unclassified Duganella]RFP15835.1 HlyD family efflux transporter periplasmic adaptor subunit [Duganella sp. BJB475]RFP33001.1 HlyD family efflux transporter periplasmic adaptor subunit [Duganella sp. BJB476]